MAMFNAFWQARVPELTATAGYYTDGRRFFGEILPAMKKLSVDREILYRCR